MASRKRPASQLETATPRPRREDSKRAKISPSEDARSDSSVPSTCSVSEDSALQSSPPASEHTRLSSMSSLQSAGYDSESSLSSSSEESSDVDSDDDEVVTISTNNKPPIRKDETMNGAQDIQARLSALLPQLAAANSRLGENGADYNIEGVEEGEQHIEMSLGLGVLKEKNEDNNSSEESASEDDDAASDDEEVPTSSGAVKRSSEDQDTHVMDKLMGQRKGKRKAAIQSLE